MSTFVKLEKPFITELIQGQKGPICHISLETDEQYQKTGKGKIAFPMINTEKPPILGLYEIIGCIDKKNYYIVKGSNIPYVAPSKEEFLNYTKASGLLPQYRDLNEKECLCKIINMPNKQGSVLCIRHWRNNKQYNDAKKAYHNLWFITNGELRISHRWNELHELIESDNENWTPLKTWLEI